AWVGHPEREKRRKGPNKYTGAARCPKGRMNALRESEEQTVTSHCVGNAGTCQHHDVERSKSGNSHGHGQPSCPARAGERPYDVRRNVRGTTYMREWQ